MRPGALARAYLSSLATEMVIGSLFAKRLSLAEGGTIKSGSLLLSVLDLRL